VNALAPLSLAYGAGAAVRAALYRRGWLARAHLAGPVISVGNLSVGGSGKTPVVARVVEILREEGLAVSVLSRGYRGSFRGEVLVVSDGGAPHADAALAGDEPVMLARMLPGVVIAVGRRRDAVGRAVEARFGPRVHVLDDGFQHLRLARDLDLLCVDATRPDDRPLPAGRLREFASAAGRADLVLLTQADRASAERLAALSARFGAARVFQVGRRVLGFVDLAGVARPAPARPFLVCGIARPERFEADVRERVGDVAGCARFADHHRYGRDEWRDLLARARAAGADALVTTDKDAVRLPDAGGEPPVLVLRISAEFHDEPRFRQRLLAAARRAA
jgi:tetraacyldisaccharide 4'-kinase